MGWIRTPIARLWVPQVTQVRLASRWGIPGRYRARSLLCTLYNSGRHLYIDDASEPRWYSEQVGLPLRFLPYRWYVNGAFVNSSVYLEHLGHQFGYRGGVVKVQLYTPRSVWSVECFPNIVYHLFDFQVGEALVASVVRIPRSLLSFG